MAKETEDNVLEKTRKVFDKITIGVIAVGAIFGLPMLVAGGALDLGCSMSAGKETNKQLTKWWKDFKEALSGKKTK